METAIATEKTSLNIDRDKLGEAAEILGTSTIAATVDGALSEVIRLHAMRQLMGRIRRDGGVGPTPEELDEIRTP